MTASYTGYRLKKARTCLFLAAKAVQTLSNPPQKVQNLGKEGGGGVHILCLGFAAFVRLALVDRAAVNLTPHLLEDAYAILLRNPEHQQCARIAVVCDEAFECEPRAHRRKLWEEKAPLSHMGDCNCMRKDGGARGPNGACTLMPREILTELPFT